MTHYDIFNYKGVSESREVARGPKDPPPGVIGLNSWGLYNLSICLSTLTLFKQESVLMEKFWFCCGNI